MSAARSIVIVGGGPAGVAAALAAKQQDPGAQVVLLNDEHCEPYEKPPLSKAVLTGKTTPDAAPIAGRDGIAGSGVVLRSGTRVSEIDRVARALVAESGERLGYDTLVLATGSTNRALPMFPPARNGIHYLRTKAEALVLKEHLQRSRSLIVIGGGLIGLEVAASAAGLGLAVTVIEMAPRILERVCDEGSSALIHARHSTSGVEIRIETAASAFSELPDGRLAVETQIGDAIVADLIVVGTGVRARRFVGQRRGHRRTGWHHRRPPWPYQRSRHLRGRRLRAAPRSRGTGTTRELAPRPGAWRRRRPQRGGG